MHFSVSHCLFKSHVYILLNLTKQSTLILSIIPLPTILITHIIPHEDFARSGLPVLEHMEQCECSTDKAMK